MSIRTVLTLAALPFAAFAEPIHVSTDNFVRAESDVYMAGLLKGGKIGEFTHFRELSPIDHQTVIRQNRDTLYSSAVIDLEAGPAKITLPETGGRFVSLQVITEDHYAPQVHYLPGTFELTKEDTGTRYATIAARVLANPNDPEDMKQAHAVQDGITIEQASKGEFVIPEWDKVSQDKTRAALLSLSALLPDTRGMFGAKDQVDPIRHLIGAAYGWGGNPEKDALYLSFFPEKNDGKTVYRLKVGEVPVDGFWSVSAYGADGYYHPNDLNAYTLNNLTAKQAGDGSTTIQFGGCAVDVVNCLPVTEGWNYLVRLYRPKPEVLDGKWTFPAPEPVE
ncbi:DUF1254 domain-containing protein [Paracoccus aestuariivivens]|uniref:DUF1254 domain-containing protein n=1 Tax=Paracoccus aestuariivivens TaxID=1820333 RepID=A0A6L6J9A7_9RHOB|nr:DUF1254 domain-containing protein [Paracoccus aestuariivivens]MTH78672.1 DUF1254 domain-containing protein [Paracoccus aestuariivivens]